MCAVLCCVFCVVRCVFVALWLCVLCCPRPKIVAYMACIQAADGIYDAAYQIEATCHAPDYVGVYKEILRVLKPGGLFAGYEWCMTVCKRSTLVFLKCSLNEP